MDDDLRALADQLARLGVSPGDSCYLRKGVVTAATRSTNLHTVTIGGAPVANVPALAHVKAAVGDVVDVLFDGPAPRIIGITGSQIMPSATLIAWARVAASTGGASNGRYGGGYGAGVSAQAVGTSQTGCGLGCVGVPVTPGNLLRIRFKFYAFGPVNTATEWYFLNVIGDNGGAYAVKTEFRLAPSGANAPSPHGEFLYAVPAGVTTINAGIDAYLNAGSGTVHRYNSGFEAGQSHYTIEDLGPAN